ncbi:hypothetical protein [Thalassotalea sp. G2M2-11]|uniref:hypothetical protein n=1 Tax=Thalassotalea sp. G2M2-11 TaxID=2787627 RepID=UPI0019D1AD93|nr:hypothetical protein [Thalassotalea sp. G2M2-11]
MLLLKKIKKILQEPVTIVVSAIFIYLLANDFYQRVLVKFDQQSKAKPISDIVEVIINPEEKILQVNQITKIYQGLWFVSDKSNEKTPSKKEKEDSSAEKGWIKANKSTLRLMAILKENAGSKEPRHIAVIQVKDNNTGKLTTRSLKSNDVIDGFTLTFGEVNTVVLQGQNSQSSLELTMYKSKAEK